MPHTDPGNGYPAPSSAPLLSSPRLTPRTGIVAKGFPPRPHVSGQTCDRGCQLSLLCLITGGWAVHWRGVSAPEWKECPIRDSSPRACGEAPAFGPTVFTSRREGCLHFARLLDVKIVGERRASRELGLHTHFPRLKSYSCVLL